MNRIEKAHEAFMEVMDELKKNGEYFALAKAFKKPRKWYREHSKDEAIEILKLEAKKWEEWRNGRFTTYMRFAYKNIESNRKFEWPEKTGLQQKNGNG